MIAPVPVKQPWRIWVSNSHESTKNNDTTAIIQSSTNQCAYFMCWSTLWNQPHESAKCQLFPAISSCKSDAVKYLTDHASISGAGVTGHTLPLGRWPLLIHTRHTIESSSTVIHSYNFDNTSWKMMVIWKILLPNSHWWQQHTHLKYTEMCSCRSKWKVNIESSNGLALAWWAYFSVVANHQ